MNALRRLWVEEDAANAVEYGLVAAIIAVGLIATFQTFRTQITNLFNSKGTTIAAQ